MSPIVPSKALPNGDRGGNEVKVPALDSRPSNLDAYWDGLLGREDSSSAIERLADDLVIEFPREMFAEELKWTQIEDWAKESVSVSLKTVYRDLDANQTQFAELPVAYFADARKAARRRAALAAYSLAEELNRLLAQE